MYIILKIYLIHFCTVLFYSILIHMKKEGWISIGRFVVRNLENNLNYIDFFLI